MVARRLLVLLISGAVIGCVAGASSPSEGKPGPCPSGMAYVAIPGVHAYCIDRWEAQVVEVQGKAEVAHPPTLPVTKLTVKAVTRGGVKPQGYISKVEAETACKGSKKRLCTGEEWEKACRGKTPTTFPYGDERKSGYCNDSGRANLASYHPELGPDGAFGSDAAMNDPRVNDLGAFDMVGNLHEWTAEVHDGSRGTFRGGYYQDTHLNGDGCGYRTVAHDVSYHDYSTGFRCCANAK